MKNQIVSVDVLLKRADKTMDGLRERLFDSMDAVIDGRLNNQTALVIVSYSDQILKSVGREIEYKKYAIDLAGDGTYADINMPTFNLGSKDE